MRMIFINLPVADVAAASEFYSALGFHRHETDSDERSASLVVEDVIVVVVHTRERFAQHVAGEVGDPAAVTTVVNTLTAGSRQDVDELAERALHAGGKSWLPPQDEDGSYRRSFTDPDGNVWEALFLEPLHVIN